MCMIITRFLKTFLKISDRTTSMKIVEFSSMEFMAVIKSLYFEGNP